MRLNGHGYRQRTGTMFALAGAAMLLLFLQVVPASGASAPESIVVKVIVNGEVKGDFFAIITSEGEVLLRRDDLLKMGFQDGRWPVVELNGMSYVPAAALSPTGSRFDSATLSLHLTAAARDLAARPVIDLKPTRPPRLFLPDELSAFLNYSINYLKTEPLGLDTITLVNKAGVHSGKLLFLTDTVYTRSDEQERLVRLMSTLTYEERDERQRFLFGDVFVSSGALGSTVNIGGISFTKAYHIDPYFIKRPMFHATGIAALPSEASIYVDGALVRKERLEPGEFEIRNLNYYGGAHAVDVVVRDPYGSESRMSYPAYFSDAVLGRGIHEFNYTVGALRNGYGVKSAEYDDPVFSAYHRYGVTNALTLGGWAEGTDHLIAAGPDIAYVFPRGGAVAAVLGGSRDGCCSGHAEAFAYSFLKGPVAVRLFGRSFSRDYATVQTRNLSDRPRREQGIGASYTAGYYGALGIDLTELSRYESGKQTIAAATYSRTIIRNLLAYLTLRTIRTAGGDSFELFVGLNYSPAKNTYLTAQHVSSAAAETDSVRVEKTVPTGEGLGYHVGIDSQRSDAGTSASVNPGGLYRGRYGTYFADYRYSSAPTGDSELYSVTAAGSVVYAGGFVGFARPVNDSFSIVKVDALPDVDIQWNGEPMGTTDGGGRLIIPELRSYTVNQITLDSGDVALEYRLDKVSTDISPSQWSGSCIPVQVDRMQAFTGRLLTLERGIAAPVAYAPVTLSTAGGTAQLLTGQNGEFYFENTVFRDSWSGGASDQGCGDRRTIGIPSTVAPSGILTLTYGQQEKKCSALLVVPAQDDIIVDIGHVVGTCEP